MYCFKTRLTRDFSRKSFYEFEELNDTVTMVMKRVNLDETLLLVTADHSHSFEIVGEPSRFHNPLFHDEGYGPDVTHSFNSCSAEHVACLN